MLQYLQLRAVKHADQDWIIWTSAHESNMLAHELNLILFMTVNSLYLSFTLTTEDL
jgi:hypothetical protein